MAVDQNSVNPKAKQQIRISTALILFIFLCLEYITPSPISSNYAFHMAFQCVFSMLIIIVIVISKSPNKNMPLNYFVICTSLIFLIIPTLLNTIHIGLEGAYQLRDFLRLVNIIFLAWAFYAFLNVQNSRHINCIKAFVTIFTILTGIIALAWLMDRSSVAFMNVYSGGNEELRVEQYWRFSGFLGNPNSNGVLFAYFLVFSMTVRWTSKRANYVRHANILLTLLILFLSSSRTVFAAIFLTMVYFVLLHVFRAILRGNISHKFLLKTLIAAGVLAAGLGYFLEGDMAAYLFWRITQSFTYFENDRFHILLNFVNFFLENPSILFFGTLSELEISGYSFSDNDYIFWTFKYGAASTLVLITSHILALVVAAKLKVLAHEYSDKGIAQFLELVTPFMLIAAFAAPVWSNPQLLLFPILILIYALKRLVYLRINL